MPSLIRPNYFAGQVLSADVLQLEQSYFLDRARRHNRIAHGAGVARGLSVTGPKGGSAPRVVVSPGTAIDPLGNEIEIDQPQVWPLDPATKDFIVVVRQVATATEPVPLPGDTGGTAMARTEEDSAVAVLPDAARGARAPGDLVLARFVRTRSGWRRDPKVKPKRLR
jgi:hypothetical protein